MKILITNDDGYNAMGIYYLTKELEKHHNVIVVAPTMQKSACSHSITIKQTLFAKSVELNEINSKVYSLNGTPADCVKIATEFLADDIDFVVSGINIGSNLGSDVLYSGTVSAAIEGAMQKKPSIALSFNGVEETEERFIQCAKYAVEIINKAIEMGQEHGTVLNVNFPDIPKSEIKGIKVCNLGNKIYSGCYEVVEDENGEKGYLNICYPKDDITENTDIYYINEGYITVTPLNYDLTNFSTIEKINSWMKF
ncbi:MAG: 5'/3'-nucleotidase SurE [Clostridium sp.]